MVKFGFTPTKELVVGKTRYLAATQLGWTTLEYIQKGNASKPESYRLIECDENLVRGELSTAQRKKHIALRAKLVTKLGLENADELIEKAKVYVSQAEVEGKKRPQAQTAQVAKINDRDASRSLNKGAEGALRKFAESEAIKDTAEKFGKSVRSVQEDVADHTALEAVGLDTEESALNDLTSTQYRRVVQVAKAEKKGTVASGSAMNELVEQMDKEPRESAVSHDLIAKRKQKIGVMISAKGCLHWLAKNTEDGAVLEIYAQAVTNLTTAIETAKGEM